MGFICRLILVSFHRRQQMVLATSLLLLAGISYAEIPPFPLFVGKTIYEAYPKDRPPLRLLEHQESKVVLHDDEHYGQLRSLACNHSVSIGVGYGMTRMGEISVSFCDHSVLDQSAAKKAQASTESYLRKFTSGGGEIAEKMLQYHLANFKQVKAGDVSIYSFPVFSTAGGTPHYKTIIAVPGNDSDAVVIQYAIKDTFCKIAPDTELCTNREQGMINLVQLLLDKWPEKKKGL